MTTHIENGIPTEQPASKIRKHLFIFSATVLLITMVLLSVTISKTLFDYMKIRESETLSDVAEMRSLGISEWRKRAEDLAKQVTSRSRIRQELEKFNGGEISLNQLISFTKPKLQDAVNLSTEIIDILRLDAINQVVTGCGVESEQFLKSHDISTFVHKKTTLSKPLIIKDKTIIIVGAPILNRAGEYQGTDLVFISLDHLKRIATNPDKIGKTGHVTVGYYSSNSIYPLFPIQNQDQLAADPFEIIKPFLGMAIDGNSGAEQVEKTEVFYQPIENCDWGLVVTQQTDELYSPLYDQMKIILYLSLGMYFIILTGFWLIIRPLAGKILLHTDDLEKRILDKTKDLELEIERRKQSEISLHKSEEKFRTIADFTLGWEYWVAPDSSYIYVSPAVERITGYSPQDFYDDNELFMKIIHPDDIPILLEHDHGRHGGKSKPLEFRIINKTGGVRWIGHICQEITNDQGTFLGRRGSNRDISWRKQAEEVRRSLEAKLRESQRLEAIGTMVGGVAHEFNNALQSLFLYAGMVKDGLPDDKAVVEDFKKLIGTATNAKKLVEQVMLISSVDPGKQEQIELPGLIDEVINRKLSSHPSPIESDLIADENLPPTLADKKQLQVIVENVIENAILAMPDGGELTITLGYDEQESEKSDQLGVVLLTIADTGVGMTEGTLSQVFNPFFTTREVGQGKGFGLSIVYNILQNMGGSISATSVLGEGSSFLLEFPVQDHSDA